MMMTVIRLRIITMFYFAGAYFFYSGIAFIGFLFFYFVLPETKGKTLEEVETVFEKPWFNCCNSQKMNSKKITSENS